MKRVSKSIGLLLCASVISSGPAWADAVTEWNGYAMQAIAAENPGHIGAIDAAVIQLAAHDAVEAITDRYEPYFAEVSGAKGNPSAAVAAAVHDLIVAFYPGQQADIDATYSAFLATNGFTGNAGLSVGQKVAARYVLLRRVAPDPLPPDFKGGTSAGTWRPTNSFRDRPNSVPVPFAPMATPWLANVDPFTLVSPARFRPDPPLSLHATRYRTDYNEVKSLGNYTNSTRTKTQTEIGYFWADNLIVKWNRGLRSIAEANVPDISDSARLFALANAVMADAVISSWDSKRAFVFWRPLTAIRGAAGDDNPNTVADPEWKPLVNTPNTPEYVSEESSITGAVTQMLSLFFGSDSMTYSLRTDSPYAATKSRSYTRFSSSAQQVIDATVYQGVNFRLSGQNGRTQGRHIAVWAFQHFLLPLDDGSAQ